MRHSLQGAQVGFSHIIRGGVWTCHCSKWARSSRAAQSLIGMRWTVGGVNCVLAAGIEMLVSMKLYNAPTFLLDMLDVERRGSDIMLPTISNQRMRCKYMQRIL